jgi:hypothetical protein
VTLTVVVLKETAPAVQQDRIIGWSYDTEYRTIFREFSIDVSDTPRQETVFPLYEEMCMQSHISRDKLALPACQTSAPSEQCIDIDPENALHEHAKPGVGSPRPFPLYQQGFSQPACSCFYSL